jgi:dTDP-4-amino-4,6-dideoxygalactose transaminase
MRTPISVSDSGLSVESPIAVANEITVGLGVRSRLAESRQRVLPALLSGKPAFSSTILVGRPNMPERVRFLERIERMFSSGRLSNHGPMNDEFESVVADIAGARYCIASCNATIALELAISALGMRGEVIVPSFTFVATVHALWRQGIRPVFCDIDPETHCLDVASVEAAITSETTGILGVHVWGNVSDTQALGELARRKGLKLLFDAAHAFGCSTVNRPVGTVGDAEVFSFHATKFVHSIEGGAVVTNDADLARRLRLMVNFGFSGEDTVSHLGTNGKMTEASAAMGLTSLESMSDFAEHNRRNFIVYSNGLASVPGVRLMSRPNDARHNFQYVVTEVDEAQAGLSRDEIVAALRMENVVARRYFYPGVHRMQPYAGLFPRAGRDLPVTISVAQRVMVLPSGTAVTEADVEVLTARIGSIVQHAPAVRAALKTCMDPRLPAFAEIEAANRDA